MPIALPSAIVEATVSFELFSPRTTSSIFMTLAGLKKCAPATASGRLVALAISSTSRADVLLSSRAPSFIVASSLAKTSFFTSICSNTASMTASQSAMSS